MKRVVLDSNIYIGWLKAGAHEDLLLGGGFARYLASPVLMELRVGATTLAAQSTVGQLQRAYDKARRTITPTPPIYADAGDALRRLKKMNVEIRRASIVNDALIALLARSIGATLFTADTDFDKIGKVIAVSWELVDAAA